MNVEDVVTRVKRIFGDEAGVQITDLDIIRWINDAQNEIVTSNEGLMETTGSADLIKDQREYDLPPNLSVLRGLKASGLRVKGLSFAEFNEYLDGFSSDNSVFSYGASVPEVFMVWEGKLTIFPKPSATVTNGLSIYYIRYPNSVGNLADGLTIPLKYHNSVVDFCLKQAYELDEDYQKASFKKGQFDETMMKLNDNNKWTSQEYYPRITTLPEDAEYGDVYGY
ncbi:phage adaptor protein [Streptomyces hebeiensis]